MKSLSALKATRSTAVAILAYTAAFVPECCGATGSHVGSRAAGTEGSGEMLERQVAESTSAYVDISRFGIAIELDATPTEEDLSTIGYFVSWGVEQYVRRLDLVAGSGPPDLETIFTTTESENSGDKDEDDGDDADDNGDNEDEDEGGDNENESADEGGDARRLLRKRASAVDLDKNLRALQHFSCTFSWCSVIGCRWCVDRDRRRTRGLLMEDSPPGGNLESCLHRLPDLEELLQGVLRRRCGTPTCGGDTARVYVVEASPGTILNELSYQDVCV
jgi:hypothetical protein